MNYSIIYYNLTSSKTFNLYLSNFLIHFRIFRNIFLGRLKCVTLYRLFSLYEVAWSLSPLIHKFQSVCFSSCVSVYDTSIAIEEVWLKNFRKRNSESRIETIYLFTGYVEFHSFSLPRWIESVKQTLQLDNLLVVSVHAKQNLLTLQKYNLLRLINNYC